jgi:hypothetical protein
MEASICVRWQSLRSMLDSAFERRVFSREIGVVPARSSVSPGPVAYSRALGWRPAHRQL